MVIENSNSETKAASQLASVLPRVLIVSRRTVRKNKFVDFVGEYHLDLIVNYGAVPVIVPRVPGVQLLLDSFEPIHGVLLCEGEDVDPSLYQNDDESDLSNEELAEIRKLHSSDTAIDRAKDFIELQLARRCLERNIPYLGICRGCQLLNVACGGTLYQDVEKELHKKSGIRTQHINYDNYDGHRHPVKVVENSPLHHWFRESFTEDNMEIMVNSYHHQGVKRLAARFRPMAYAPDGLIEAFYDPNTYNPEEGQFIMGLQFHPERMQHDQDASCPQNSSDAIFDYPGCPKAYQEFVKAVIAYQKKLAAPTGKLDGEMEKQRKRIVRSFSIAKLIYEDHGSNSMQKNIADTDPELAPGALFLQLNTPWSMNQVGRELDIEEEKRLKQMGATVRNSGSYMKKVVSLNKEKKEAARRLMEAMTPHQLSELVAFYQMMTQIGAQVMEQKLSG